MSFLLSSLGDYFAIKIGFPSFSSFFENEFVCSNVCMYILCILSDLQIYQTIVCVQLECIKST